MTGNAYPCHGEFFGFPIQSPYLHPMQLRTREGKAFAGAHTPDEWQSGLESGFLSPSPRSHPLGKVLRNGSYSPGSDPHVLKQVL